MIRRTGFGRLFAAFGASSQLAFSLGRYQMKENYSLKATPLKPATPMGLDVAAGVGSP
jgi:hypothetical protein